MNTVTSLPKVNVFVPGEPEDHVKHLRALAKGIPGAKILPLKNGYTPCDVAVVFGVGKRQVPASYNRGAIIYEHRFRQRKPVMILERGFVNRADYYGVALDGLNGLGYFGPKNNPPDRWENLGVKIKRWRRGGSYILVCGQVPWDASVQHTDHVQWCIDTYKKIEQLGASVRFRPHPDVKGKVDYGLPEHDTSFEEDCAGAKAIVTFSSTTAALAVLDGVPIFALDPGSIVYDIANTELTEELLHKPAKYDREQWAYDLAYSQWTAEEMETGEPWRRLWG
jgi:hypothetical protein|tara:strand:- start:15910 stop:16749 length:840 start_codon:yes stop_codon:yes gene_type:complete